jgi:hypothetical protein
MVDSVFLEGTDCECDVTLDTWLKDTLPNLPGVNRSVAARQLVLAAREFFEKSLGWVARIDEINAKAGVKQYWLSPYDEYSNIVAVLGVAFLGQDLAPLPARPSRASTSDRPSGYYVSAVPDAIELYPQLSQDVDDAICVYAALTPKQSVEHLPRVAAIKFYDAILDGFLARMYIHPNKPYSAPSLARTHRAKFLSEIGRIRGEAKRGFSGAPAWRYPLGWGVRRPGGHG